MFKVVNVDDHGQERNPGRIEITESELIWYQRNKEPIRWPLNSLRRYGFDAELFSFECGRRCPTGPGIYAFKCRQAEALFNLLQESVQRQRTGQDDVMPVPTLTTATIPTAAGAAHQPLLQQHNNVSHNASNGSVVVIDVSRNNHVSGAADRVQASGREAAGSPLYVNDEVNCHEYINTNLASSYQRGAGPDGIAVIVPPAVNESEHVIQYAELDLPATGDYASLGAGGAGDTTPVHLPNGDCTQQQAMYINIPASDGKSTSTTNNGAAVSVSNGLSASHQQQQEQISRLAVDDPLRGYANVDKSVPSSAVGGVPRVNYAQLMLLGGSDGLVSGGPSPVSPVSPSSNPESPTRKTDTYAMIDIERTQALNNRLKNTDDEGSRKTRHNSNIEELL